MPCAEQCTKKTTTRYGTFKIVYGGYVPCAQAPSIQHTNRRFIFYCKESATYTFKLATVFHILSPLPILPVRYTTLTIGRSLEYPQRRGVALYLNYTISHTCIHETSIPCCCCCYNTDKIKGKRKKEIDYLVSENLSNCEHRFTNST